jgi:hypothetical protein
MKQLLNWFRLRRLESDLDRELKYHIDRRMSDLMLSGLPEPEEQTYSQGAQRDIFKVQSDVGSDEAGASFDADGSRKTRSSHRCIANARGQHGTR